MNNHEKKSFTVYLIALVVILANLIILSVIYQVPFLSGVPAVRKVLPLISFAAVYPFDFFHNFLREDLAIHFFWIMLVIISGFGLLLFNKFARTVFIVFNIINFVIWGVISVFYFGQMAFWGYFFKCYFNFVAFLFYVGYLTLPEVRQQFHAVTQESRFKHWFLKARRRTLLPKDAAGYYNLALAYRRLGRVDEALDFLSRAIAIVPKRVDYHFASGQVHFDRQDYSKAIAALVETVRLDPIHLQGRYLLGLAYQKIGCVEEAVQAFRRCSYLELKNNEVFRDLGIACYHAGYLEESQQALRRGIQLQPHDHVCPFYLGLVLMKDSKTIKDAEEFLKKSVRLNPGFCDGYRELGNLYVGQGNYKAAVRAFRDVLRLDENLVQVHYHLGFAYAMLKDMESARREYKFLKDVDPDLAQTLALLLKD